MSKNQNNNRTTVMLVDFNLWVLSFGFVYRLEIRD